MPSSLNGTGVTFNDATTQSTANNLPANTTNVLSAYAGASALAVGTYTTASATGSIGIGGTTAGGNLRAINAEGYNVTFGASGTWRNMGSTTVAGRVGSWLRIS